MTTEKMLEKFENLLVGLEIKNPIYGKGIIKEIKRNADQLIVAIEFGIGMKSFNIAIAIQTKNIVLPEHILATYNLYKEEAQAILNEEKERTRQKKLEEKRIQREAEAAEAKRKAEEKAARDFEKTKKRMIQKFEERAVLGNPDVTYTNEYYYSLGWLANHARTTRAALPDFLEGSFIKYFGAETPRSVTDSSKKTIGGYISQWSYSFTMSVKDPETAPMMIQEMYNPAHTAISDTSFIWELVERWGFRFGKSQDVNIIRSYIPEDYLADFEAGLIA